MVSSTRPTDPNDVAAALAAWGLEAAAATPLPGTSDHRWQVAREDATFVLRRYDAPPADAVAYEHDLLTFLAEHAWPVAVPVAASNGATLVEAGGAGWVLSPTLPGATPPDESIFLQRRGALLALVHADLAAWDHPAPRERTVRVDDFDAAVRAHGLGSFEALLARVQAVDGRSANALAVVRARIDEQLEAYHYAELPAVPLWGACTAEHVLFDGNDVTGLLNFDGVRLDARIVDVATSILADTRRVGWRIIRWVAGYAAHATPSLTEREADLVPVVMAALTLGRTARALAEAHAAGRLDADALAPVEDALTVEAQEGDIRQVIRTAARLAPV